MICRRRLRQARLRVRELVKPVASLEVVALERAVQLMAAGVGEPGVLLVPVRMLLAPVRVLG